MLIPLWLFVGVTIAGALYPGYSHLNQAMSELGAVDAPTRYLSPIINNYPLGMLFIVFGLSVFTAFPNSGLSKISGLLIVAHGIGSIAAGLFPCDQGCDLVSPSVAQVLHFLSSSVMYGSLLMANLLWIIIGKALLKSDRFALFSLVLAVASVCVLPLMALALTSGEGVGIYQRINYGANVIWVAGLAYMLLRRAQCAK